MLSWLWKVQATSAFLLLPSPATIDAVSESLWAGSAATPGPVTQKRPLCYSATARRAHSNSQQGLAVPTPPSLTSLHAAASRGLEHHSLRKHHTQVALLCPALLLRCLRSSRQKSRTSLLFTVPAHSTQEGIQTGGFLVAPQLLCVLHTPGCLSEVKGEAQGAVLQLSEGLGKLAGINGEGENYISLLYGMIISATTWIMPETGNS